MHGGPTLLLPAQAVPLPPPGKRCCCCLQLFVYQTKHSVSAMRVPCALPMPDALLRMLSQPGEVTHCMRCTHACVRTAVLMRCLMKPATKRSTGQSPCSELLLCETAFPPSRTQELETSAVHILRRLECMFVAIVALTAYARPPPMDPTPSQLPRKLLPSFSATSKTAIIVNDTRKINEVCLQERCLQDTLTSSHGRISAPSKTHTPCVRRVNISLKATS